MLLEIVGLELPFFCVVTPYENEQSKLAAVLWLGDFTLALKTEDRNAEWESDKTNNMPHTFFQMESYQSKRCKNQFLPWRDFYEEMPQR